jgi:glyoxylase-like metal-dependent hydrolase (beta-lactamase superfamily II)
MLRGVQVRLPNSTFRDKLSLYVDDLSQIELVHPGYRAHTDGDTIVHMVKDRVVFAGDILWVNYHTNLEDADIQGLVRASKMILRLRPRRIVPGHGPVSGVKEIRRSIKYLEQFDRNSSRAIRKGLQGKELYRASIPSWSWNWGMRWMVESYLDQESEKN